MALPERLAQMRREAGLSQQELAEQIYVTRQAISQWENGVRVPNFDNLVCLSKLYGVSVDYLLHGEAAQEPQAQTGAAPETVAVEDVPETAPIEEAPAAVAPEKAPVAVAVEEAPKPPARRMRRWQKIAIAVCAVALAALLALYIFRSASSETKAVPLEDLSGEEVVIPPENTFSFD